MTLQQFATRLQRVEQTVGRQAQHARFVLVEWHEGKETEDAALARAGVDLEDAMQIVVVVTHYA